MDKDISEAQANFVLEARGIAKSYGQGNAAVRALKEVSFSVGAGELIAILGPSGSGKSTLLNILGLMDQPEKGEIFLSGKSVAQLSEDARARWRNKKMGFVFQFDSLLSEFTILENVLFPALIASYSQNVFYEAAKSRALELLNRLGLSGLSERFPSQVSGGERQRAALCRALINEPEIILADEPTGNLDKVNGEMVFKDLENLTRSRKTAVVLVTHNDSVALWADRVFHMQDGSLIEAEKILAVSSTKEVLK